MCCTVLISYKETERQIISRLFLCRVFLLYFLLHIVLPMHLPLCLFFFAHFRVVHHQNAADEDFMIVSLINFSVDEDHPVVRPTRMHDQ